MMWLGLLCLVLGQEPGRTFEVDNKGMFLPNIGFNRFRLPDDGTFLALSRYHVWHWDEDGRLINRIGGKGEGPGEFGFALDCFWDGKHYWVIDGNRLNSSIFDSDGRFLSRTNVHFRQFLPQGDRLFALNPKLVDPWATNFPPLLEEIEYQIVDGELHVATKGLFFKKVSPRQMDFAFNFKLLWMVIEEDDRFLVMDQLEPKILIYDEVNRSREAEIGHNEPFEPASMPVQARLWIEPPFGAPKGLKTQREHVRWWCSWSRINHFAKAGDGFLIGYEIPDKEDGHASVQVIQKINATGRGIGDPFLFNGFLMGSRDNTVYIFFEEESSDEFRYTIKPFIFPN